MELLRVKCPSCGADLDVTDGLNTVTCAYCGTNIIVANNIVNTPKLSRYLALAKAAIEKKEYEEALLFFNKEIETDPNSYKGWLGKGKCTFSFKFLNTHDLKILSEVMDYFEQAFTVTPDKFKDDVSKEIKRKTKQCCDLFYEFHKSKFQNSYNNDGWLWRKLATDIYKSALEEIISILDRAIAIPEEDGVITRTLCNYSINLIKQGPFDKEFTKSKLTDYYNKIKEIDPGFQVPEISDNNCFIATATMGDNNHPYVINLRLLRDKFLLPNALGRILVAAYYFCSPPFASIIAKSPTLRNISLTFLIKPLNKYAVKLLWPSK